jgi:predicted Zn-dependent protease
VEEAVHVLRNGVKAHPKSAILHFRYGVALLQNGKKEEGVAALKKSLELGDFAEKETAREMIRNSG